MSNDILKRQLLEDLNKVKEQTNFTLYELFKNIGKIKNAKIYPLTIKENKRIGELLENLPKNDELNSENFKENIDDYLRRIKEVQMNINEIVSEKVLDENNNSIKLKNLNLLDYQFILLYLFSITNQSIKYKIDLNEKPLTEKDLIDQINGETQSPSVTEEVIVDIPITTEIMNKVKSKFLLNDKMEILVPKNPDKKLRAELEYKIVKLNYDIKKAKISSEKISSKDFKGWLTNLKFKISDNIELIFKPITIIDYLNIYLNLMKIKNAIDLGLDVKITTMLLDTNLDLFYDSIIAVKYNGEIFDAVENPDIIDLIYNQYLMEASDDIILKISEIIYGNVFRMEIDIKIYNEDELIKQDTWFDTGLSFFLSV